MSSGKHAKTTQARLIKANSNTVDFTKKEIGINTIDKSGGLFKIDRGKRPDRPYPYRTL